MDVNSVQWSPGVRFSDTALMDHIDDEVNFSPRRHKWVEWWISLLVLDNALS